MQCFNFERPTRRPHRGPIKDWGSLEYPFHDRTLTVPDCGRIRIGRCKINLSRVFAGQKVGVKEVSEKVWLVTCMHYDLGFSIRSSGGWLLADLKTLERARPPGPDPFRQPRMIRF